MSKEPTRYFSSRQEEYVASLLGGRTQPNSGATPFFKGDVLAGGFLIECKTTTSCKESFTIKQDWIEGLNAERIAMRKPYSALAFQFCPQGSFRAIKGDTNYFVVDEYTFFRMFRALLING